MPVRFPEVVLPEWVLREDGFHVVGMVRKVLKEAGVHDEHVTRFTSEAFDGDYEDLIATVRRWVTVGE